VKGLRHLADMIERGEIVQVLVRDDVKSKK
jgi:hypothetical protein